VVWRGRAAGAMAGGPPKPPAVVVDREKVRHESCTPRYPQRQSRRSLRCGSAYSVPPRQPLETRCGE
jgi:hypothetical protein